MHPFILADNRHYTFYLYRRFFSRPFFRYAMCVVYSLSLIFIFRLTVNSQQKLVRILMLLFFTFGVLFVTGLVEFRYFTIPLVYLSFEISNRSKSLDVEGIHWPASYGTTDRMYPTILLRLLTNLIVMAVFLYRPFDKESRFMW